MGGGGGQAEVKRNGGEKKESKIFIQDLETYKKYSAFLSKGFVENNANMKW